MFESSVVSGVIVYQSVVEEPVDFVAEIVVKGIVVISVTAIVGVTVVRRVEVVICSKVIGLSVKVKVKVLISVFPDLLVVNLQNEDLCAIGIHGN